MFVGTCKSIVDAWGLYVDEKLAIENYLKK